MIKPFPSIPIEIFRKQLIIGNYFEYLWNEYPIRNDVGTGYEKRTIVKLIGFEKCVWQRDGQIIPCRNCPGKAIIQRLSHVPHSFDLLPEKSKIVCIASGNESVGYLKLYSKWKIIDTLFLGEDLFNI